MLTVESDVGPIPMVLPAVMHLSCDEQACTYTSMHVYTRVDYESCVTARNACIQAAGASVGPLLYFMSFSAYACHDVTLWQHAE